jgi:hypothetical protein
MPGAGYRTSVDVNQPSPAPISAPATTSLRKCMPSRMREAATFAAQNSSAGASGGMRAPAAPANANAVMEWPEGKEN